MAATPHRTGHQRWITRLNGAALFGSCIVATYEGGFRDAEHATVAVAAIADHMPEAPQVVALPPPPRPLPKLVLRKLAGSDEITVVPFDIRGEPSPPAFAEIKQFLGTRSGADVPIHPELVSLMMKISDHFDGAAITIVSGHREPGRGTRRTSYHVSGNAADISVDTITSRELHAAVKEMDGARGIGLYPHFVHVDVRPDRDPFRWVGGGWRRSRR